MNFTEGSAYLITAMMTLTWLAGAKGGTFFIWPGLDIGAIAACAIVGILANQLKKWGLIPMGVLGVLSIVWTYFGGLNFSTPVFYSGVALLVPLVYALMVRSKMDFGNRWVQIPASVISTGVVAAILLI